MAKIKGNWKRILKDTSYYNNQTRESLAPVISKLAAVANKRLKRLEAAGKSYSDYAGKEESIAGVKKFGAKGKTLGELRSEYKRLQGFLESETSTLTGRKERYYQATYREWKQTHKQDEQPPKRSEVYKEYAQGGETVEFFDALSKVFETARNEGWLGKSGALQKIHDSDTMRQLYEERIIGAKQKGKESLDDILNQVREDLGIENPFEDSTESDYDVSTSSFFK